MKNNKLTTTMMMTSSMMPILYQSSAGAKLYILLKVGTNSNQLGKLDFLPLFFLFGRGGTYIVHTNRYYCFEIVLWVMESSTLNMQMIMPRKTFRASIKRSTSSRLHSKIVILTFYITTHHWRILRSFFAVTSEGSIRMEENEELWVIETDQGDGWTRVRRIKPSSLDPMPEGFVPTSYIDTLELFSVPQSV